MVNYESVITLLLEGGLGILDLRDLNKTLVAKWIYSYSNNKNALWRKVVSKCDPNYFFPILGNSCNKSVLVGFVHGVIGINGRAR